jgi:hypothetical protein
MEGYKVSYSRVASYMSCPQKHYFGYVEKLKPKGVARPLFFGGDFHKLLENRHKPKALAKARKAIRKEYEELTPKQQMDLGEGYLENLDDVFSDYLTVWADSEAPIETEHEFLIIIGKYRGYPVYFHGKIDEVYDDRSFGEHKTFNQMPDMGLLAMNMQAMLYAKAWELETGEAFEKVRWDYIKSTPAKHPIWLEKSGRFSEASNSGITDLSWIRACEERGIEDMDVMSKARNYEQNRANFFFRCSIAIVPEMVDSVWTDFKSTVKDLVMRSETNKTKNITRDCTWCNYRPICYAEFTGGKETAEYVKKIDYVAKGDNKQ